MSGLEKFDSGLQAIFTSYRDVQRHGAENVGRVHPTVARGAGLYIYLTYDPPLAPIEALGFKTVSHARERRAYGLVQLQDLEAVPAGQRLTDARELPVELGLEGAASHVPWSPSRS